MILISGSHGQARPSDDRVDLPRKRRDIRRRAGSVLVVAVSLLAAGAVIAVLMLATAGGGGPQVPDVVGATFARARETVQARDLSIEVDPLQDSSSADDIERLVITRQDPKPGSRAEKGEPVTVTLKGLADAPPGDVPPSSDSDGNTGDAQEGGPAQPAPGENEQPATQPAAPQSATGRTVCLDPGHSANSPASEMDPATGLNVADNSGADGELQAMWELALKTRARLEQMGFRVVLTRESADSYASLRRRADIGNTCSIVVRLHYDPALQAILYPGEGQYKENGGNRVMVDPGVAAASGTLARALLPFMQVVGVSRIDNDMGGTSSNSGPAFVGSVLSRVPVVLIENDPGLVRGNPAGQDRVADAIAQGVNAYF